MSIPPNQFRRDHLWTRFVLLDSSAGPVPSQAKVTNSLRQGARLYMQRLICFFRSVCKLIPWWICSQNQPICQPALLSNAIRRRLKSQCFCMCIIGFFLSITLMSGLLLLVSGRALLMNPKG